MPSLVADALFDRALDEHGGQRQFDVEVHHRLFHGQDAADLKTHCRELECQRVVLPLLVQVGGQIPGLGELLLDASHRFLAAQGVRDLHRQVGHGESFLLGVAGNRKESIIAASGGGVPGAGGLPM